METRYCPDCGHDQSLDNFYQTKAKRYKNGVRYSAYCKKHHTARTIASQPRNPERKREQQRKASRNYYQKTRSTANYRDRNARNVRAYRQRDPERTADLQRVAGSRARAKRKAAPGSYTAAEWRALCRCFGYRCVCCGVRNRLAADHVVPLARGGTNDIANIQPLCKSCNSRKHAKTEDYRDPVVLAAFLASLEQT